VTRPSEICWNSRSVHGDSDRLRPILCADSRRHSKTRSRIDAHRKSGALLFSILLALLRKLKLVGALAGQGEADPSAGLLDHEVYELRRYELGGTNQITFVLAVFVIRDDDELAGLDVGDCLLDSSELHPVAPVAAGGGHRFRYGATRR